MTLRTIQTKTTITLLAAATLAALLALAPTIKRESTSSRQALTKLETNPMDPAALTSLADWSHPGTLDASKTKGKVVLLAVVSAADPQSVMAISTLTRLQETYSGQGLIVAAIHPEAGFEQVNERIIAGKITIPIARDADGIFAAAMYTDDYPDLYLIDRAGNLRFADLNKRSLKKAVKLLISETPESATTNAKLQAQGLQPEQVTTGTTDGGIDLKLYEDANWPPHNTGKLNAKNNIQGKPLPVPMGREKWVYNERSLENKVLVLDFWATWCPPCLRSMPMFEELQDHFDGKLEIVGIGGNEELATFKKFVLKKKGNYAQMFDRNNTLYRKIGIQAIPHVVVISTDGIIRWQGNPLSQSFVEAVNTVIEVDPMFAEN